MKSRYDLLQRGIFPEVVPPCFTSHGLKRALSGIVSDLKQKSLHNRPTDYIRYSGTKHDRNRRYFGSPNPFSYFYVASFIAENWKTFEDRFANSGFSVSSPKIALPTDDRPIIIPSLSELTTIASQKLGYSAYILKTDVAQFFPSIYTHSIAWSAHGITEAKADQDLRSKSIVFNRLDSFVRACQLSETRGVIVGPDAFRLVAEFIISGLDKELEKSSSAYIVGVARHVDDYYIGIRLESEALLVLSKLREILQRYNLNINDGKTKILSGVESLNELWAQDLRRDSKELIKNRHFLSSDELVLHLSKAFSLSKILSLAFQRQNHAKMPLREVL